MITLLNTSIITAYGVYAFHPISLDEARRLVKKDCTACYGNHPCQYCGGSGFIERFDSAIGHESTAEILTELLGVGVPVNRQNYIQELNSVALVFKLKTRAPEGVILNREQIEKIGYEFGLLARFN